MKIIILVDGFYKHSILDIPTKNESPLDQETTLYINNLKFTKDYFRKRLNSFGRDSINALLNKIVHKLKFNLYEIDNAELDECLIFETMNNRGKELEKLELLKNRLIYLSTLMDDKKSKKIIRESVNNSWKTIYEYLGKPSNKTMLADKFLLEHYRMYWGKSDAVADKFLLHKFFIVSKVLIDKKQKETYHKILVLVPEVEPLAKKCMSSYKRVNFISLREDLEVFLSLLYELTLMLTDIDEENRNSLHYFLDNCKENNFKEDIEIIIANCTWEGNTKNENIRSLERHTIGTITEVTNAIEENIDKNYVYLDLIDLYSSNIQDSIKSFYFVLNPEKSDFSNEIKEILMQINRINLDSFIPTIMGLMNHLHEVDEKEVIKVLKLLEKFIFVKYLTGSQKKAKVQNKSYQLICEFRKTKNIKYLYNELKKEIENYNGDIKIFDFDNDFYPLISKHFKIDDDDMETIQKGYFVWSGLKLVLSEYEFHLRKDNKNKGLVSLDKYSIEHIYPSTPEKDEWSAFSTYNKREKYKIRNSIGNLLLISLSRNIELQNKEFKDKKKAIKLGTLAR